MLKKLGLKALDALPGIIGEVLSWLLPTLSKAVGWLAEHVYLFVTGVGMMVIIYIQNQRKTNSSAHKTRCLALEKLFPRCANRPLILHFRRLILHLFSSARCGTLSANKSTESVEFVSRFDPSDKSDVVIKMLLLYRAYVPIRKFMSEGRRYKFSPTTKFSCERAYCKESW